MSTLPQENSVDVGGINYRLSKSTLPLLQEFIDWAKSKLPDPFDGFQEKVKGLSPDLQKYIYDKCEEKLTRRNSFDSPEIVAITNSIEGMKKQVGLLLRKHQPHLTEANVSDIIDAGVEEHGESFLSKALGEVKAPSAPTQPT